MNRKQVTDFTKALGSHFVKMSQAHSDLADSCEPDSPAQQAHQSIAASCGDMGEKCLECLKTLVNADTGDFSKFERDYSQLAPTNVSAVPPDAPDLPAGLRRVPRPGQPQVNTSVPNVEPVFQKVFAIDDDEN